MCLRLMFPLFPWPALLSLVQYRLPSSRVGGRWVLVIKNGNYGRFDSDEGWCRNTGSMCAVLALNSLQKSMDLAPPHWSGKRAPTPPEAQALGAKVQVHGLCKEFNARTAHIEPGVPTPTSSLSNPTVVSIL